MVRATRDKFRLLTSPRVRLSSKKLSDNKCVFTHTDKTDDDDKQQKLPATIVFSGRVMVNSRLKLKRAETLLQDASCHPIKSMSRVVRNPLRKELHISGADDGRPRRRNENLSLGVIQRGIRHDRNPNALSFEDLVICEDWIDTYFEFARKQV